MAPKKDKGKKEEEKAGGFSEVERTFLEQQVAECNRKIARLRAAVEDYEVRNEELQNAYEKLDEDRADIIAYLKKLLNVKNEENSELKEKVKGLEEIRDIENAQFRERVNELERNFTMMKDQLTSENKLLAGKLNTLEEFRAIRDDLMKKFEKQEKDFEDQEMKYKRIIYEAEKKFVIGKDKLKKEMEARLLQLAQDFQDATELRIAASTHRVIRENIAISNELDNILSTQKKVSDQNEMYKENVRSAIIAKELAEEERDKAINKSVVQLKVIDQLTAAFENIKKEKGLDQKKSYDFETLHAKIQKLSKENENLTLQVRILEQNLHAKLSDQNKAVVDASKTTKERDKLRKILQDAAFAIQAALKLDQWAHTDPERESMDRQFLFSHLLEIVSQYRDIQGSESLATLASFSKVYDEGDLGFVPKSKTKKKAPSAFSLIQQIQKQQELVKGESKKSVASSSMSPSSAGSLKTIPSIQVLPETSAQELSEIKPSIESFVTSTQSTTSGEQESEHSGEEGKTAIEKQLLASKLEIQKSILKDLAFSQLSVKKSSGSLSQKPSLTSVSRKPSITARKSVTIMDDGDLKGTDESLLTTLKEELSDKDDEAHGSDQKTETPPLPQQEDKKAETYPVAEEKIKKEDEEAR